MINCSAKNCYLQNQLILSKKNKNFFLNRVYIPCRSCYNTFYCSEKCRIFDWDCHHKNHCKKSIKEDFSQRETKKLLKSLLDYEVIRYQKSEKEVILGKGSFGVVKLVRYIHDNKLYAMKIMDKKHIFNNFLLENIKEETKIHKNLKHKNIIKLYQYFEDKEKAYLIIEYAEKGSLFDYIRLKGYLSEQETIKIFKQILKGIEYLHSKGIIHRDLKPENILLDLDQNVKICDFGWSIKQITEKNGFFGTLPYMPIFDTIINESIDVFSLGIILFEMLEGKLPIDKNGNKIFKYKNNVSDKCQELIKNMTHIISEKRIKLKNIWNCDWIKDFNYKKKIKNSKSISKIEFIKNMETETEENEKIKSEKFIDYCNKNNKIQEIIEKNHKIGFLEKILDKIGCFFKN